MPTSNEIDAKVGEFVADQGVFRRIVQGGENEMVQLADGRQVKTVSRVIKDLSEIDIGEGAAANLNASKLSKSGDTMTGILNMSNKRIEAVGAPDSLDDAVRLEDLQNGVALKIDRNGDSMAGDLNMTNYNVKNVKLPTDIDDAASKRYVDAGNMQEAQYRGDADAALAAADAAEIEARVALTNAIYRDALGETAPMGGTVLGETPLRETRNSVGDFVEAVTDEGNLIVDTPKGLVRVGAGQALLAPLSQLVGGERPFALRQNQDGNISEAWTYEGGHFVADGTGALRRVTVAPAEPDGFFGNVYANGAQQLISFNRSGDTALLLIHMGQSNAMGQNSSSTAMVATAPVYPANAFMFANGPRRMNAVPERTLVPLIETNNGIGQKETAASGLANHLIRDIEAATGKRPTTLSFVTAMGSRRYMELNPGSDIWENFLVALRDSVAALRTLGFKRIRSVVTWSQGESDPSVDGMTPSRYVRQMQQLSRNVKTAIREATGSFEDPIVLVSQNTIQNFADYWINQIRDANVMLDGIDDLRLAGPIYSMPYSDEIHLSGVGQHRMGQMFARAALAELFGAGWRPVKPVKWYFINATTIQIEFDTNSGTLTFDTSGTTVSTTGLANQGFNFDDGSGSPPAITNVQLVAVGPYSVNAVRLSLASAPTGKRPRVAYASVRATSQTGAYPGQSGPTTGPRGTLRDTVGHISLLDGSAQHNWAASFAIEL